MWKVIGCAAVLLGSCASDPVESAPDAVPEAPDAGPPQILEGFTRHLLSDELTGPAYVSVADLDGDGAEEVIVSALGASSTVYKGELAVFTRGATLDDWTRTTLSTDYEFANQNSVTDIDGDGDLDILQPSGFFACSFFGPECGAVAWFEQTDEGWVQHDVLTNDVEFFHQLRIVDLDGDGNNDMLTVGESYDSFEGKAELLLFRGQDSAKRFESAPTKLGEGLGGFVQLFDIDGDGDLDAASSEYFYHFEDGPDSFAWLEQVAPDHWQRHVINDDSGPSIMLAFVDDLYGDGVTRAIGSNHTNTQRNPPDEWESAIFVFDIPEDPTQPWPKRQISTGIVSRAGDLHMNRYDAPGIFGTGDVDGDGDVDVVVAGDGDPRIFWLEQTSPGEFTTHVLQDQIGQAGGMVISDLDHDGKSEIIVTGWEDNVVYIFERD